jgi:FKBP-type peptidyl-prolyl cis-trans isomerase
MRERPVAAGLSLFLSGSILRPRSQTVEAGEEESSMKTWQVWAVGIVSVALSGCEEPTGIVPAGPPGMELQRPLPPREDEEPQALGEAAVRDGQTKATMTADASKLPLAEPTAIGETKTTATGVKYETLKEGTGPVAKGGQSVMVHYTGTLQDGKVFDTSRSIDRTPYSFIIGISPVIKGWSDGVAGMRVGERRKLTIPPDRAYGILGFGQGRIPSNATLIFDIELLSAK